MQNLKLQLKNQKLLNRQAKYIFFVDHLRDNLRVLVSNFLALRNNKKYIREPLIIFILLLIIFLRFWRVGELFYFGIDEEYQSLLALSIIKDFHIIWIGLAAANTGFYLGPGLVYVHSLLLWISRLDPLILAYAASFIGLINAMVLFLISGKLFSKKTALIATCIYSFSFFVASYDRRFWNSTFVPLIAMLFYYAYVRFRTDIRWLIAITALLGLSFHIHASLFIYIPISLVIIIKYLKKLIAAGSSKFQLISIILLSIISFLVFYSPLIIFDYVHNYDNLKTPLRMLQGMNQSNEGVLLLSHFDIFSKVNSQFFNIALNIKIVEYVLALFVLAIILYFLISKQTREKYFILFTIVLFYLIMFFFYPGKMLEYYYLGFLPFMSLVLAYYLTRIKGLIVSFLLFALAAVSVYRQIILPVNNGLKAKKTLIKKTVAVLGDNDFYLNTSHEYLYFGGWRYLFEAYGKKPGQSQADQMFGWIYNKEISTDKPGLEVIISQNQLKGNKFRLVAREGSYYAYIIDKTDK